MKPLNPRGRGVVGGTPYLLLRHISQTTKTAGGVGRTPLPLGGERGVVGGTPYLLLRRISTTKKTAGEKGRWSLGEVGGRG